MQKHGTKQIAEGILVCSLMAETGRQVSLVPPQRGTSRWTGYVCGSANAYTADIDLGVSDFSE